MTCVGSEGVKKSSIDMFENEIVLKHICTNGAFFTS
jgi:hypothetical protein